MDAAELKRELAKIRGTKGGRYPASLRDAVLDYTSRAKRHGKSQAKVAAELGMSVQTLCYWRGLLRNRGALAPVTIVAPQAVERDIVVECGPLRVRGLGIEHVAELLRRLA
jgi:transposase-like protein